MPKPPKTPGAFIGFDADDYPGDDIMQDWWDSVRFHQDSRSVDCRPHGELADQMSQEIHRLSRTAVVQHCCEETSYEH